MVALHNELSGWNRQPPRLNLALVAALGINALLWAAIIAAVRQLI